MSSQEIQLKRIASGKIGELLVELELTKRGWHVERLDGAAKAANGDLIAIKAKHRVIIQVKTNGTQKDRAYLGHAGGFLERETPFFNAKFAPITTDIVVSVVIGITDPYFFVFTTDEAEHMARGISRAWYQVALSIGLKKGEQRSPNFPVSPKVEEILEFRNAWDKLENI